MKNFIHFEHLTDPWTESRYVLLSTSSIHSIDYFTHYDLLCDLQWYHPHQPYGWIIWYSPKSSSLHWKTRPMPTSCVASLHTCARPSFLKRLRRAQPWHPLCFARSASPPHLWPRPYMHWPHPWKCLRSWHFSELPGIPPGKCTLLEGQNQCFAIRRWTKCLARTSTQRY